MLPNHFWCQECLSRCSDCKTCVNLDKFKVIPPLIRFNMQPEVTSCLNDMPRMRR